MLGGVCEMPNVNKMPSIFKAAWFKFQEKVTHKMGGRFSALEGDMKRPELTDFVNSRLQFNYEAMNWYKWVRNKVFTV